MNIELTEAQQSALDSEGPNVKFVDPRTNAGYVLVPIQEFETVQEILEDDRRQLGIHRIAARNAGRRTEDEN